MSYVLDAFRQAPSYTLGRDGHRIEYITLHHWGNLGQTHSGVVAFFLAGPGTSAHEVISAGRVSLLVRPGDTAWSNGNWDSNLRSYSLELRPEMSDADFETAALRIADLWKQLGRLPLRVHNEFSPTTCPGKWEAAKGRLEARALQHYTGITTTTPTPTDSEEEEEMMKGCSYKRVSDNTVVHMLFNEASGFYQEFHAGVGKQGMGAGYNNPIAQNWKTGSWPTITEAHAKSIKENLIKVRQGK